jgi:2-dehydro-3-deoxy-D-gluconate 5-dehydrogenase
MGILDAFNLEGKVALVTGSSRGLGQGIAVGLAEAGADVAGLDILEDQSETAELVKAQGREYMPITFNLMTASVDELNEMVGKVVEKMGGLDILFNNAGIISRAPLLEFSEKDWDDVLQINLKAMFFLSQAAARVFEKQQSGKIINTASMLSYQGGVFVPSYTASKSGVAGLTRALANELAPMNVCVNAIAPGYMATDNTTALREDPVRNEAILARIPAGRWGTPDDLKGMAVFLASAASDYLNGSIINVDGGWLSR